MFDMESGLSQVDSEVRLALSMVSLHYLVSWPLSTLNDYFHDELCCRRPLGLVEDAFMELAEFVVAQSSYQDLYDPCEATVLDLDINAVYNEAWLYY